VQVAVNDETQVTQVLERRRADWMAAIASGDSARYAELLTSDAVWFSPQGKAIAGRAAIEDWLAPIFADFWNEYALGEARVRAFGDRAAERGSYINTLSPREGAAAPTVNRGEYFVLWRRERDGAWRIERWVDVTGLDGHQSGA
jgi:uncharacterized protein (TIGR02246 family)